MSQPVVGVVVLAYGEEPLLAEVLDAVLASRGVHPEVVVVDNGYRGDDAAGLQSRPVRWLRPGGNTGFTGGCNLGARELASDLVAFLNSDAVVDRDALAELAAVAQDPDVGIATAQVLLYDEPDTINSAGNPVHYSLLSWAGGWGDPASSHAAVTEPASASGCLMMMRRSVFEELRGFHDELFAYGEDVDVSLRTWQAGYRVRYVPSARVWHKYEFSRNPNKYFLLERNRWINLLTLFEGSTLLRLSVGLAAVEAGIWFSAVRGGWAPQKVESWRWLWRNRREVRQRRAWVQGRRRVRDKPLLGLLELRLDPSERSGESVPGPVNNVIGLLGRIAGLRGHRHVAVPASAERGATCHTDSLSGRRH